MKRASSVRVPKRPDTVPTSLSKRRARLPNEGEGPVASPQLTVKLGQILEAHITWEELSDFASIFGVGINADRRWLAVARALTENLNQGNTRFLVEELVGRCETRNSEGIAHTTWERRDFHHNMAPVVTETRALLETEAAPGEITLPAGNPFSAKSKVRELLETSTGEVFVVDPYVGVGTLDCLRGLNVPIRLLTANHAQAIEPDFARNLAAFVAEGHNVTVRTCAGLRPIDTSFSTIVAGLLEAHSRTLARSPSTALKSPTRLGSSPNLRGSGTAERRFPEPRRKR
jgi:hypothetical protein